MHSVQIVKTTYNIQHKTKRK